MMGGGTTRNT